MNIPIINPWLIYAINTINNISSVLFDIVLLGTIGFIVGIIAYFMWRDDGYWSTDEDDVAFDKQARLYLKRCGITLIIILSLYMVIPTKETMYTMIAMKYVTTENINGGIETVKSAVDYVFEKIDELNDSKSFQSEGGIHNESQ